MANIIKIKRSTVTSSPVELAEGELAYSELSKNLFIGKSGGNIGVIGGEWSSANTIEAVQDIVGGMIGNSTDDILVQYDNVDGELLFTIVDSGVVAGTYGATTKIPVVTVDSKGRVTSVSEADVATALEIAGDTGTDTIDLLNDTLSVVSGDGLNVAVTDGTITVTGIAATQTVQGMMSAEDKTKLDALQTWYTNMTTEDGDGIINTVNEMLAAFNNNPESLNVWEELTAPTSMELDGGTY